MHLIIRFRLAAILLLAALSTGCASIKMKRVEATRTVAPGKALVTFVRPAVVMGDAMPIDLWDGMHFIGALRANSILQYEAAPGEHLFMARTIENWSYASGELVEGKRYYIKGNFFPGLLSAHVVLGVADRDDRRIDEWHALPAVAPSEKQRARFEATKQKDLQRRVKDFRDGDVRSYARITDQQAF